MSEEALKALTEKRAALMAKIRELQSDVFHIDGAITALGGRMAAAAARRQSRLFGPGELMRLVGEAERAGESDPRHIAISIMRSKHMDLTDRELVNRMRWKVTDCRRRMTARGV